MVACDVTNPLTGPEGASAIYGPQKGATPEMVTQLDSALGNFAEVVRRDLGVDVEHLQGSGAAGGLGGGMVAFLNAELRTGVDIIMDIVNIDDHLKGADLVITGEGELDYQTLYNKAPIGVAQRAQAMGVPVVSIAGTLGDRYELVYDHGIDGALSIPTGPMTLDYASEHAAELITQATERMLRLMQTGARGVPFTSNPVPEYPLPYQHHVHFTGTMHACHELVLDVSRPAWTGDEVHVTAQLRHRRSPGAAA